MSRLRAGPDEVSGAPALCSAVCYSSVGGAVPVMGQISICSVSRPPPRHSRRHQIIVSVQEFLVWFLVFCLGECPFVGGI